MTFQQSLDTHFPGAMRESDFVQQAYDTLAQQGFTSDNTIACVGVCRDELTRSLITSIEDNWGNVFTFSSLAGMLFAGKTGFGAAHAHSPIVDGRESYLYVVMPHIAIDGQGKIGLCQRQGRAKPSGACGALMAFRQELLAGPVDLTLNSDDIEQSLLKQRLSREIDVGMVPNLVELTKITHRAILADLQRMIGLTVNLDQNDYAVLSGIQIHGPDETQYIWPQELYMIKHSQESILNLQNGQT